MFGKVEISQKILAIEHVFWYNVDINKTEEKQSMSKHRYVIADKSRFFVFCVSVLLACVVGGYLMGAAAATKQVAANANVVYYAPQHFANQRGK